LVDFEEIEKLLEKENPNLGFDIGECFREIRAIYFRKKEVVPLLILNLFFLSLIKLLPVVKKFNHSKIEKWNNWLLTAEYLVSLLKPKIDNSESISIEDIQKQIKKLGYAVQNPKFGLFLYLSAVDAMPRNIPIFAILFIHNFYLYQEEKYCNDKIYHMSKSNKKVYEGLNQIVLDNLKYKHIIFGWMPDCTEAAEVNWLLKFKENALREYDKHPKYPRRSNEVIFLSFLIRISSRTDIDSNVDNLTTDIDQSHQIIISPTDNISQSTRSRPTFTMTRQHQKIDDERYIGEALAPDRIKVISNGDVEAVQPTLPASISALEVRYSNYRTAIGNQRLPWQWDNLNSIEIELLVSSIVAQANEKKLTRNQSLGSFLVWLTLLKGQSLANILEFGWGRASDHQSGILFGLIYRRKITTATYAYEPKSEESKLLEKHHLYVDLKLLPPYPALINHCELLNPEEKSLKTKDLKIKDLFGLNEENADKYAREYLATIRTRTHRLLIGRIRNVLGQQLMNLTNDPVLTHLISALETDMPPTGVYYTSYQVDELKNAYHKAVKRITKL